MLKLGVNIDHVATLREARYRNHARGEPDPIAAALACEAAGAHSITAHLREDRRHIQDRDIWKLREAIKTRLNLEMANAPGIVEIALDHMPECPTKIMMNVGNPELAFEFCQLPNEGVGLARLEFIINRNVGIHPRALLEFDRQPPDLKRDIESRIAGYASPTEFYVAKVTEGVATIAAAFFPKPVIVRLSDFKSNEYSNLVGGSRYEPHEENPMLGFRGASRYTAREFYDCFALECAAMRRVRGDMGFTNVELMVPFVRTVQEAEQVVSLLARNGLRRGENGLRVIMMCEIPSNALLAHRFLDHFDGFSIGSNDMTQLTLGVDRDAGGAIASTFDERDDAVKVMLKMAISACRERKCYVGICGQGPSDHPDLAQWLVEQGIESISLNPDTVVSTWMLLAKQNPR